MADNMLAYNRNFSTRRLRDNSKIPQNNGSVLDGLKFPRSVKLADI